ncbi:glycerol-3-phosphate cytidylyltransferase [bacterium]|uniref:glycerol-3-phosphate cytidylyltransferase n=1 Tax=Candidatus Ventrenecus sp. TaxID=3085654 RepID=UPI001D2DA3B5|nr:glycerol-3-phosphate cytidylyltransferase [bacterium]
MKINVKDLITFILLTIFCTIRFWGVNLVWYINVAIRLIIIVFLILSNNLKIKYTKKSLKFFKITMLPIVLILVYSCALWLLKGDLPAFNVITNLFSSSIYLLIDSIFAILLYSEYKEKSVDMFVKSGFASYIVGSVIPLIFKFKSAGLLYLLTSYSTNYDLLYLTEVNDLTFGIGFCMLYYLFFDTRDKKHKKTYIILCFLLIFWGLKRIEIFALILCYLFYKFILRKFSLSKASIIATISVLIVSYAYVMFIHNNELISLADKYDINFMGRLTTYQFVAEEYSEFSPLYLGIGFGYIDEILDDLVKANYHIGYIPVISLHSDILRMYIGIGFIAFGLWIIYQIRLKTKIIQNKIDYNCAKAYLLYTVFLFVLYLTDNTYSYPITFTLYLICTLATLEKE